MTIIFKTLSLRNFLSTGQITQTIDLDRNSLTLVLGENQDLGGSDAGSRNGVGKTAMVQALSYALFGTPINNIRKDNLINRTNAKNMLVTVDFEVDGNIYRIERGRRPNILKFFVNNVLKEDNNNVDVAQGENRVTQSEIERVLNMSADMFKHIVALNTHNEPFLSMRVSDQRQLIEQLLGITLLSEKAEAVKELIRKSKDAITEQEITIKANEESNRRVAEQIESLKRRQSIWIKKRDEDLRSMAEQYDDLSKINIDHELQQHDELKAWNIRNTNFRNRESLLARQSAWAQKNTNEINALVTSYNNLLTIDIDAELQAHHDLAKYKQQVLLRQEYDNKILSIRNTITKEEKNRKKLESEIATLRDHRCYACGQEFHDEKHTTILNSKIKSYDECVSLLNDLRFDLDKLIENPIEIIACVKPHYATETEALKHSAELESIQSQIISKQNEVDPYAEQISEIGDIVVGIKPKTHYDTEQEALVHSSKKSNLLAAIKAKDSEIDPYAEQIEEMQHRALVTISWDRINALSSELDHQKFLLDLLTNKDSFVRKRIIDQNLSYLNSRLSYYLERIGLPHQVVFTNDLGVQITEMGREMDFHNMSRGEMNRVILSLNFAFRDVWESLYKPVNIVFIDELLDSGMDSAGVENGLAILKNLSRSRNKSVWLISHRDELASRVTSIMRVLKESGFTSYNMNECE